MPLPADLLTSDPDRANGPGAPDFFGGRWALGLSTALLVLFSLTILARSLVSDSPAKAETILQQPVTPDLSAAAGGQRSDVTAPDPGDTLP